MNKQIGNFLDTWLQHRAEQEGLSGFSVAIRQDEDIIYERTFQTAGIGPPLSPSSIFNVGSQAKLITATLILQSTKRGELSLDMPIAKFVPWLADHKDPKMKLITIEQVLWHGAGLLRDGLDADYWQLIRPFPDNTDLRKLILDSSLVFRSGYKLKYSNLGYALLGEVLKTATGMDYAMLVKKYIAQPLALKSLAVHLNARMKKHVAPGYTERIGTSYRQLTSIFDTKTFASVVGCYATASDMTRLVSEILSGSILLDHDTQLKLIEGSRAHWVPENRRGSSYGLGVISQSVAGQTIIGHSGMMVAHGSATYTNPKTKTTVAVISTSRQVPVNQILIGIFEALDFLSIRLPSGPTQNDRFNTTLQNLLETVQILNLEDEIISIHIGDWYPFDQVERLEVINGTTLKITHAHDYSAEGELIHYVFSHDVPISVRYAGITMWPKDVFRTWLSENTNAATVEL